MSTPQQPHNPYGGDQPAPAQPSQAPMGAPQPGPYQQGPYQQTPGQPGAQTPYGQPGYYPQQMRPTNTYAIISLVSSFFIGLVGVIFGHLARKQIRETGEAGDGLAIAGLIIGYISIGFWVLMFFLMFVPLLFL
ncbi:DUF4190 domain-containing protein [Zhihengliuella salsuginis]|uniref:DUF4190 domain-containing protein n=1 Tax=Zhihengliuella salsuginis TaxID=578222 RepID=A0ABQ3GHK4_9MICC|nr:DUF4190 domain-containing protein [Zhihengliuella salsuginis]GHD06008.1 hypothetical protein GCM10008096_15490 [Zhihengliuella salsuginis]